MVLYHTAYNPCFKQNTGLWNAPEFVAQLTRFIPRACDSFTITGCTRHGARHGGRLGPMSHVSPRRAGAIRTPSNCP